MRYCSKIREYKQPSTVTEGMAGHHLGTYMPWEACAQMQVPFVLLHTCQAASTSTSAADLAMQGVVTATTCTMLRMDSQAESAGLTDLASAAVCMGMMRARLRFLTRQME